MTGCGTRIVCLSRMTAKSHLEQIAATLSTVQEEVTRLLSDKPAETTRPIRRPAGGTQPIPRVDDAPAVSRTRTGNTSPSTPRTKTGDTGPAVPRTRTGDTSPEMRIQSALDGAVLTPS